MLLLPPHACDPRSLCSPPGAPAPQPCVVVTVPEQWEQEQEVLKQGSVKTKEEILLVFRSPSSTDPPLLQDLRQTLAA